MKRPQVLANEKDRLKELDSYSILDTLPEEDFDNLTAIASEICGTHISLVSLIDEHRQWFKSHHGLEVTETPKEYAFCAHAINKPQEIFIVEDASKDERFHDNPLVTGEPHIGFYTGVPLVSANGFPLGTLCVIDREPKQLSANQINSLKALSRQVMNLLELRKKKQELEQVITVLRGKNDDLEKFAYLAAHDLKSPLASIGGLTQMVMASSGTKLGPVANGQLEMIQNSADRLKSLVDGLLAYNTCLHSENHELMDIDLKGFEEELHEVLTPPTGCKIVWKTELSSINVNYTALKTIMTELISNAIRYTFDECIQVEVSVEETGDQYKFCVKDHGIGIAGSNLDRVFEVFQVIQIPDRFNTIGNGIGLATVKKTLDYLGGTSSIASEEGKGSEFAFSLRK